ncbi:WD40 repeat-like protein [Serendipita vermifera]|nr:WD40 repeat-like protein [Serendipita vermifera]
MSSLLKRLKHKKRPASPLSDRSPVVGTAEESNSDSKYQTTRDNLIGATKVVKAVAEAASFLGPLRSTCEIVILFLEKTKAINESIDGFKALSGMLKSHIDILEDSWRTLQGKETEPLLTGQQDFLQALNDYIKSLKSTLGKVDQVLKERENSSKSLFKKIGSTQVEPGALVAYQDEITQYSKVFDEAMAICQMNLQAEALKAARLGPEKPRPMGTQHETCLKGTREPILQEIREWRSSKEVEKRIFWLCDIGGSGKSTVAYTMSQEWDEESDILLGRFFFSRNARDTADTDVFCSTLARDLASKHPELSSTIADALRVDSLLTERDFTKQFNKLIVEPLLSVSQDIIFVLDAVDECKLESRKRMLRVILKEIDSLTSLKILLTSRPESDIMNLLQDKTIVRGMHFQMQGSKNQSNLADITSYVNYHLTTLLSSKYKEQLITQSNGLFIWVSTARFELEMAADNPAQFESALNTLLERGAGGDLRTLYLGILNRVLRGRYKDLICRVLSTLAILYEPVSITGLGRLMNANDEDLELVVKSMRSVFRVVDTIEFLHPTFREYLNGIQGKGTIFDAYISHSDLALSTLATLQEDLKRDICDIDVPGVPFRDNKDIEDLNERLSSLWRQYPGLFYSSQYWALHVSQAIQNVSVIQRLGVFLETKVLNLVELLSLMNHLLRIQDILELQRKVELCEDIWRLVQSRQTLLEGNALHIYSSGLLFLPIGTKLSQLYRKACEGDLPDIVCGLTTHWPHYRTLAGHDGAVECFSISPDGTRIVSGSYDKTVRIWDATTGASIENALDVHVTIKYLAFSSDGSHVIVGTEFGFLTRWNWSSGEVISTKLHSNGIITGLGFSSDETRVIFSSNHRGLVSCDAITGEPITMLFQGNIDYYTILSSPPDGSRVICVHDSSFCLWDAITGQRLGMDSLSHYSIKCLAFSPDISRIALGREDGTIHLWDVATGLCFLTSWKAHEAQITCLAFSPDGTRIVSGSDDGTLQLWDTMIYSRIGAMMKGHKQSISCLQFSSDGKEIVSGSYDRTIRVWDGLAGSRIGGALEGHTEGITCVSFLADSTRIVSGSSDGTLRLWNVVTDESVGAIHERHNDQVEVIVFSLDGSRVLSGSRDGTLRLWDTESGTIIGSVWEGHTEKIECVAFSLDGTRVVSAAWNETMRVWNVATGLSINESTARHYRVHQLVFSPDGTKFISCKTFHSMQLWDATMCSPIGNPIEVNPSFSLDFGHATTFFEDGVSFSINTGAIFKISDEGISNTGFLPLRDPPSRSEDDEIIYKEGSLVMRDVPCHTFALPTELRASARAIYQAKIALGSKSGRVMILDFSKLLR